MDTFNTQQQEVAKGFTGAQISRYNAARASGVDVDTALHYASLMSAPSAKQPLVNRVGTSIKNMISGSTFVKGAEGAGQALAAAGIQKSAEDTRKQAESIYTTLTSRLNDARQSGDTERVQRLTQALTYIDNGNGITDQFLNDLKTNKEIIASAISLAALPISEFVAPVASSLVVNPIAKLAVGGVASGGTFLGLQGASDALRTDGDIEDVIVNGLKQGVIGGVAGAGLGVGLGVASKGLSRLSEFFKKPATAVTEVSTETPFFTGLAEDFGKVIAPKIDEATEEVLRVTTPQKFNEYLKIAQDASKSNNNPYVYEVVGKKVQDLTEQVYKQVKSLSIQKNTIISKAKNAGVDLSTDVRNAILTINRSIGDSPAAKSAITELKKARTAQQVDRVVDSLQDTLYKANKDLTIPVGSKEDKILKSVTGKLNSSLKAALPKAYADLNEKIAYRLQNLDTINKALGEVVGDSATRGASLAKSFFSPQTRTRARGIFDFLKRTTNYDVAEDATLGKFFATVLDDSRTRTLLEGIPTSRGSATDALIKGILDISGANRVVKNLKEVGSIAKARELLPASLRGRVSRVEKASVTSQENLVKELIADNEAGFITTKALAVAILGSIPLLAVSQKLFGDDFVKKLEQDAGLSENSSQETSNSEVVTTPEGFEIRSVTTEYAPLIGAAYEKYPELKKYQGILEATLNQESSMGTDDRNYNPKIGESAWLVGATNELKKELDRLGISYELDTPKGAIEAMAAYYDAKRIVKDNRGETEYQTPLNLYLQRYKTKRGVALDSAANERFTSAVNYYGK